MKKILLVGLVLIVGMFGVLKNANCASVDATGLEFQPGSFNFGLEQEYIFGRDMKSEDFSAVLPFAAGDPVAGDLTQLGTIDYKVQDLGRTMVNIGYQMSNNLNIYAKLGVTNGASVFSATNSGVWVKNNRPSVPENFGTYKTTTNRKMNNILAGAIGFKLSFPFVSSSILGVDAQYLTHKSDYGRKISASVYDNSGKLIPAYSNYNSVDNIGKATVSEWHIAPFVAKNIGNFNYYAGFKYSDFRLKADEENLTLSAKDNVGAFLGTNIEVSKSILLNIEGRFIDETAVTIGGAFFWGKKPAPEPVKVVPVVEKVVPVPVQPPVPPAEVITNEVKLSTAIAEANMESWKINFELEKFEILPQNIPKLQHVAQMIKEIKPSQVMVEGHTNNIGDPEFNLRLSQDRARVVRSFLVAEGVDEGLIKMIGYGGTRPIADGTTEEGSIKNRRVEFVIISADVDIMPKIK